MKTKKIISEIEKTAKKYQEKINQKLRRQANRRIDLWILIKIAAILFFTAIIAAEYFDMRKVIPAPAAPAAESIESKIGQMLIVGFRGTQAQSDAPIAGTIKDLNLGGVILFDYDAPSKTAGRNIADPEQTKKLVADLKSYSQNQPLLVAIDAEGGQINRLKPSLGFADIASAQSLAKLDGSVALENYWDLAKELVYLGFNLNFAPVVDLNINPKNPAIGGLERSYSKKPAIVSTLAKAMVAAHKSFGILTALKHFPGHGSSKSDSHLGLVDVTDTYQERELDPYEKLIKDGAVDSVMTAHIVNRNIDPDYPATLSPKFIQNILREKLGFDGVVFSDDMQMGAIVKNYGFEDAIIRAINAGCDILVFSNNNADTGYDDTIAQRAHDAILNAVRDGRITESRINQSYERIMKLKNKLK